MRESAQLVVIGGPQSGQVIPLVQSAMILGRGGTCQIIVKDDFASRRHAQIVQRDECYWLRDLNSKNGTLLDGRPVEGDMLLADGSVIQIGDTRFRFHDPAATMTHPSLPPTEDSLRVDPAARQVWCYGQLLSPPLSAKQFDLLLYLWQRVGQAVNKDDIAAAVWPETEGVVYDYQVDKMVSRLRERLREGLAADGESEDIIETVWGYGYRLR
jgi:pSer/pThr/pTyr-binding forkhead associated (FHA) protein